MKVLEKDYTITEQDIIWDNHPTLRLRSKEIETPLTKENEYLIHNMQKYVDDSQIAYNQFAEKVRTKITKNPDQKAKILEEEEKNAPRAAIGIAACQINISRKLFYINVPYVDEQQKMQKYICAYANAKIYRTSEKMCYLPSCEGCLSVHKSFIKGNTERYYQIWFKAYDIFAKKYVDETITGIRAIVFQHEYDHTQGNLFIDHLKFKQDPFHVKEGSLPIQR